MENGSGNLLPLIREYESAIDTLTSQVEFYAHEQEHLRQDITTLINENKCMAKAIDEIVDTRAQFQSTDKQNLENNLVDNLKTQVSLTLQEKDTVVQLWQNSLKTIDNLEEELRLFAGRSHGFISKSEVCQMKHNYENQIQTLEEQLAKSHTKIQTILKTSSRTLEIKNTDLEKSVHSQKNTDAQIHSLENEVKQLQTKISEIMRMRDKLQISLESKDTTIKKLKVKDIQAKAKVSEAIQIVEAAFLEKDAALLRENKAKEEVAQLSKNVSEMIDEASEKLKNEVNAIKQDRDTKVKQAEERVNTLKEELNTKIIQLEKSTYDYKILENDIEKVKKGNLFIDESHTSKLLILEKNLESTFQKLLISEKKLLKTEAQNENLKMDLEQMADSYQDDVKKRNAEQQNLKHELHYVKKRLKMYNENLNLANGEVQKLKSTIQTIRSKDSFVQNKLTSYLETEMNLNKKWKKEMHDIIRKYEAQITDLKNINKCLKHKLKQAINHLKNKTGTQAKAQMEQ